MLRKLASFFFQEEEIILEEDLKEEQEENYKIPEIKPMKAQQRKEPVSAAQSLAPKMDPKEGQEAAKISKIDQPVEEEVLVLNKSKKITADIKPLQPRLQEPTRKKVIQTQIKKEDYKPQAIISPIFGGSHNDDSKPIKEAVKVKKNHSRTTVISPMFGVMEEENNEVFNKDLLKYNLSDMLSSKEETGEVQVSLYDYLEELENEK